MNRQSNGGNSHITLRKSALLFTICLKCYNKARLWKGEKVHGKLRSVTDRRLYPHFSTADCAGPRPEKIMGYSAPPQMTLDVDKHYSATIKTGKGDLELELFAADVPVTVNNFVFLAREGFYDNTTFHRVIAGFMAQGGDPAGTGTGGPGYRFADEFTNHKHVTGALSMANAGPNTNGSQFFITYAPQPHLDGRHSVFGQLVNGMDILKTLENGDSIISITIEESSK